VADRIGRINGIFYAAIFALVGRCRLLPKVRPSSLLRGHGSRNRRLIPHHTILGDDADEFADSTDGHCPGLDL
jgi:hypothetical protein